MDNFMSSWKIMRVVVHYLSFDLFFVEQVWRSFSCVFKPCVFCETPCTEIDGGREGGANCAADEKQFLVFSF